MDEARWRVPQDLNEVRTERAKGGAKVPRDVDVREFRSHR